jgi:hypothetical protein
MKSKITAGVRESLTTSGKERRNDHKAHHLIQWTSIGSLAYATARYHVFKDVPWSDWPMYTLNKALALAALVLILVAVVHRRFGLTLSIGRTMSTAGAFAALHVLISLALFSPAYYAKFFVLAKLTAAAGLATSLGAIAAVAMAVGALPRQEEKTEQKLRSLALLAFVAGSHAAIPGLGGWFEPATWPGLMPPITLLAFLVGCAAIVIAWWPKQLAQQLPKSAAC